ncbi:hypothetical protein D3C78_1642510 [compost metagenome]
MNALSKIEQHNPIGTDGFESVEYAAPTAEGIQHIALSTDDIDLRQPRDIPGGSERDQL